MAEPDDMVRPPELHETTTDAEVGMLDMYLSCTAKCMEGVQKLPSPKFNTKLCEYLRNKLRLVVGSASSFLEVSRIEHNGPGLSVDTAMLMLVRAKEIEIFILGCSEDAWIHSAMTMTNVSEHVASIGFDLELCRVVFCKECGAAGCSGLLSLEQVKAVSDEEVRIVKAMALVDGDTLFRKVVSDLTQESLGTNEKNLAAHLLQRLIKLEAVSPSVTSSGSSWYSGIGDSFLSLYTWVSNRPEQIGRGVSAVVYKGMWLGKPVAKKTFEGRDNPEFMKEVEILAKLCHPNITSMFCCQKNKRSCSILMELMDGNLHDLLEGCGQSESESPPFTILEKVEIMLEIGEGVTYLHEKGVIHRDLKSRNILVKSTVLAKQSDVEIRFVRSKVTDFGISKTKSASTTYSCQTMNTGTDRWMAPEVIDLGGGREVSPSSEPKRPKKIDVYSFGMLCYEILTGDIPFSHETYPRVMKQKILKGERPGLPGDCPLMLKALIEQCWDQTPEKRPSFPTICSKLKYVKYLLMAGLSGNDDPHPTSESANVDVQGLRARAVDQVKSRRPRETGESSTLLTGATESKAHEYAVFINHREPVVKKTFVAFLDADLRRNGFRPFLDAKEIARGRHVFKSIDEALKDACVHVAIFSKRYAESKYCLNELCDMLKSGKPILPVFYHVKPEDLRWIENGPFKRGFEKHRRRGRLEEIEKWKEALRQIGDYRGFRLDEVNGSEEELMRSIRGEVQRLIPMSVLPEKPRYGLAESKQKVLKIVNKVGVVGLGGMGGIGYTTRVRPT